MSLKGHKFLLVGTGSYSNRGCEAIVRGTVEILTTRFPDAGFILSAYGRNVEANDKLETDARIEHRAPGDPYIKRFSLPWWKHRILLRTRPELQRSHQFKVQMEAFKTASCALEIGGDNYSLDYGSPDIYLQLDKALLSRRKPVVIWGASVGPFTKDVHLKNMMREHLSCVSLICARETETVSYLESIGVEKNVKLVADPAFLMKAEKPSLAEDISQFIDKKPIGLNLSPLVGSYKADCQGDQWVKEAGACIKKLVESGTAPVLLVPHVIEDGNDDYAFMVDAVEKGIGWSKALRILPPDLSAAEYKWVISRTRAFIGTRTHSTIAAFSSSVPTISIGYSMKAQGINKDILGHLRWMLPINELTPDLLLKMTKELLMDEWNIRDCLEKKKPEIEKRALAAADHVAQLLK